MRKIISLTVCLVMLVSLLGTAAACSITDSPGNESDRSNAASTSESDTADLYSDLPAGKYDGYEFRILNNISNYGLTTMDSQSLSSPVDAAVYSRNRFIEEQLGIAFKVIDMEYTPNKDTIYRVTVASGDYEYDMCYNESWAQSILARQNVFVSVNRYEKYLSFDKPWWYKSAMDDMRICGNLYYVIGDMQMMWNDSIWSVAFNKNTTEEFKTANPYELVTDGKWTFEKMYNITLETKRNGASENFYGVTSHIGFASAMLAAGDIKLIVQDDKDGLTMPKPDDNFVSVYGKILNCFFADNGSGQLNYIRTAYTSDSYVSGNFPSLDFQGIFTSGHATFMSGTVGDMRTYLPSADMDYGIVPMPKYSESQEQYIGYVYEGGAVCGIPVTVPNDDALERTATVMEWLCAYSYKLVKPEYYDIVLQGKTANDLESTLMLDIIFGIDKRGKTVLELDNMFRLGTASAIQLRISDASSAILSAIDSQSAAIRTKLNDIVSYYRENAE